MIRVVTARPDKMPSANGNSELDHGVIVYEGNVSSCKEELICSKDNSNGNDDAGKQ